MTGEEFRSQFQLLRRVTSEGVRTFHSVGPGGMVCMVHVLEDATAAEVIRARVDELDPPRRERVLELLDVEGSPVLVTKFILDFESLEQWLAAPPVEAQGTEERVESTSVETEAGDAAPPPVMEPDVPRPLPDSPGDDGSEPTLQMESAAPAGASRDEPAPDDAATLISEALGTERLGVTDPAAAKEADEAPSVSSPSSGTSPRETAPPPAGEGFTDAFEAVAPSDDVAKADADAPARQEAEPPPAAEPPASATPDAPPSAEADSDAHPPESDEAPPESDETPPPSPGGFTQAFGAVQEPGGPAVDTPESVDSTKAPEPPPSTTRPDADTSRPSAEEPRAPESAPSGPGVPAGPEPPDEPGEFTALFEAYGKEQTDGETGREPTPPDAPQSPVTRPGVDAPPAEPPEAGRADRTSETSEPSQASEAPAGGPGSFTREFQARAGPGPVPPPPPPPARKEPESPSGTPSRDEAPPLPWEEELPLSDASSPGPAPGGPSGPGLFDEPLEPAESGPQKYDLGSPSLPSETAPEPPDGPQLEPASGSTDGDEWLRRLQADLPTGPDSLPPGFGAPPRVDPSPHPGAPGSSGPSEYTRIIKGLGTSDTGPPPPAEPADAGRPPGRFARGPSRKFVIVVIVAAVILSVLAVVVPIAWRAVAGLLRDRADEEDEAQDGT